MYNVLQRISSGSYGIVLKGQEKKNKENVAIKVYDMPYSPVEFLPEDFIREVYMLCALKNVSGVSKIRKIYAGDLNMERLTRWERIKKHSSFATSAASSSSSSFCSFSSCSSFSSSSSSCSPHKERKKAKKKERKEKREKRNKKQKDHDKEKLKSLMDRESFLCWSKDDEPLADSANPKRVGIALCNPFVTPENKEKKVSTLPQLALDYYEPETSYLTPERAQNVAERLLYALHEMRLRGLVHRDIKLWNMIVEKETKSHDHKKKQEENDNNNNKKSSRHGKRGPQRNPQRGPHVDFVEKMDVDLCASAVCAPYNIDDSCDSGDYGDSGDTKTKKDSQNIVDAEDELKNDEYDSCESDTFWDMEIDHEESDHEESDHKKGKEIEEKEIIKEEIEKGKGKNEKDRVFLIDFGLSVKKHRGEVNHPYYSSDVCTMWTNPPELLMGATSEKYDEAVDVWSLGATLAHLYFGRSEFSEYTKKDQMRSYTSFFGTPDESEWPGLAKLPSWRFAFQEINPTSEKWLVTIPKMIVYDGLRHYYYRCPKSTFQFFKDIPDPVTPNTSRKKVEIDYIFEDLVRMMMAYNPARRLEPWEALQHPFFSANGRKRLSDLDWTRIDRTVALRSEHAARLEWRDQREKTQREQREKTKLRSLSLKNNDDTESLLLFKNADAKITFCIWRFLSTLLGDKAHFFGLACHMCRSYIAKHPFLLQRYTFEFIKAERAILDDKIDHVAVIFSLLAQIVSVAEADMQHKEDHYSTPEYFFREKNLLVARNFDSVVDSLLRAVSVKIKNAPSSPSNKVKVSTDNAKNNDSEKDSKTEQDESQRKISHRRRRRRRHKKNKENSTFSFSSSYSCLEYFLSDEFLVDNLGFSEVTRMKSHALYHLKKRLEECEFSEQECLEIPVQLVLENDRFSMYKSRDVEASRELYVELANSFLDDEKESDEKEKAFPFENLFSPFGRLSDVVVEMERAFCVRDEFYNLVDKPARGVFEEKNAATFENNNGKKKDDDAKKSLGTDLEAYKRVLNNNACFIFLGNLVDALEWYDHSSLDLAFALVSFALEKAKMPLVSCFETENVVKARKYIIERFTTLYAPWSTGIDKDYLKTVSMKTLGADITRLVMTLASSFDASFSSSSSSSSFDDSWCDPGYKYLLVSHMFIFFNHYDFEAFQVFELLFSFSKEEK